MPQRGPLHTGLVFVLVRMVRWLILLAVGVAGAASAQAAAISNPGADATARPSSQVEVPGLQPPAGMRTSSRLREHSLPADAPKQDVGKFEEEALKKYNVAVPAVPPRYRTPYFAHIWGGGYSAGYYAYLWSEVLDDDAFAWFKENGGMTRENGQRFRDMVLSRGSTEDMAQLYRTFRGHDPSVEPLLEQRGLKPAKPDGAAAASSSH